MSWHSSGFSHKRRVKILLPGLFLHTSSQSCVRSSVPIMYISDCAQFNYNYFFIHCGEVFFFFKDAPGKDFSERILVNYVKLTLFLCLCPLRTFWPSLSLGGQLCGEEELPFLLHVHPVALLPHHLYLRLCHHTHHSKYVAVRYSAPSCPSSRLIWNQQV